MSKKFSFRVCSILRTRKLKILFAALDRERTPFEARVRSAHTGTGMSEVTITAATAHEALYFEKLLRDIKKATYEI